MKYCPFTHRIRLILSYKKIPHDNVNINIKNKPKWYLEVCINYISSYIFKNYIRFI